MKKSLFFFLTLLSSFLFAQVGNNSFEQWESDTAVVGFGLFPNDTVVFQDPVGWTSVNGLSGADTFGSVILVGQSTDAYHGQYAIRCETQKLDTVFFQGIPFSLTIPGLILNGNFDFNPASLITGGTISPMSISTAGTPIATRKQSITGYYNYTPVPGDSMVVWAVLKAGQTKVAEARFQSAETTNGYVPFSADFVYNSCLNPDTLVILISSSLPDLSSLFAGSGTGINPGSVLLADSISVTELPAGFDYNVFANADFDTIAPNTSATIDVSLNDANCDGDAVTYTLVDQPQGSATLTGSVVSYTPPTPSFLGLDSLSYDAADGGPSSRAWVYILVAQPTVNINEQTLTGLSVYPNPSRDQFYVSLTGNRSFILNIFDLQGRQMMNTFVQNKQIISTAGWAPGMYTAEVQDETGARASVRIVVQH